MGDLTKFIDTESQTTQAIYAARKKEGDSEGARGYLGASIIGHECSRYLWYTFRHCGKEDFPGRLYRLFERGDLEEARFVNDLRSIGCVVHDVAPDTGEQFEVNAVAGHFSGHMDGCAQGVPEAPKAWHVLEMKTHNAKSYKKLIKAGCQESKPMHYAQMQIYMHLTDMRRALYLACNKDTDEIYTERIRYDATYCKRMMIRAEQIIYASQPPEPASKSDKSPPCRWCCFRSLCRGDTSERALPCIVNCRTCCHATPERDTDDGRWTCSLKNKTLSILEQGCACNSHIVIPGLIQFAVVKGGGQNADGSYFVEYQNHSDKSLWQQGNDYPVGQYSSLELTVAPAPASKSAVHVIKQEFHGKILAEKPNV